MNQGRIIVITGAPGTGKTTTASAVAKESDLEKSVHMHTDDFYHYHVRKPSAREYDDCCNEFWNVTAYVIKGLCRKEILFAIDHFNQIVRHELLRMISWKVGIETGFKLSVGKNYKFIERYVSEDLWEKLLSTYRMDSYENIWEALFLCHQLFRAVSGEVAEWLHYAYPEYDRNITKYTRDMYKKYTGKTGCLDSTYAADIEERREQWLQKWKQGTWKISINPANHLRW
ncbi:streptomycin adenylyltransferase [Mycoplasmopsis bovirhinis]|nr:streptomycin adenylyltransferase [Mycoplasmopsis bovirhinis]